MGHFQFIFFTRKMYTKKQENYRNFNRDFAQLESNAGLQKYLNSF